MRARIVRLGNSHGIRLPRPLLERSGLAEEVEIHAEPGRIIIESAERPQAGWAEAAHAMAAKGKDTLLDPPPSTQFDKEEWMW